MSGYTKESRLYHLIKQHEQKGDNSMRIINLTQHIGAPEQAVVEPDDKKQVQELLTFVSVPSKKEMKKRAEALAAIAVAAGADAAMIGGAPYFMSTLERALTEAEIQPLYAFSERVSVEETDEAGNVTKRTVFRHAGWVEV